MDTTQVLYLAGAFVLGFLVAWFAGRSGPKRALEECEANAHSLQRSLDERTRSVSKLESQVKERTAEVDRLGGEGRELNAALQAAKREAQQAAQAAADQAAQLQTELDQAQSDRLLLQTELDQVREAYAGTHTRLAELAAQQEAQEAAREAAQEAAAQEAAAEEAAGAERAAEQTALTVSDRSAEVDQLTTEVQLLQTELEAVRANAARLAGQVALRPQLSATQQQEYAGLAGDAQRVMDALHARDLALADARAEADYLRRTVGMLTGMGAELANELERRRREQQVLLYQVAGLSASVREGEMRQLVDRQAPSAQPTEAATRFSETSAGTIEPEGHDLPVSTRPDNTLETDDQGAPVPGVQQQTPTGTIEPEGHDLPVSTRPDNALESTGEAGDSSGEDAAGAATAVALDLRNQLDERTQELEALRTQSEPLQANLDELQAELEALNATNADLEAQLEAHDSEMTDLRNRLASLQTEAESAAAAKSGLEEKLNLRGAAWSSLLARISALNADLDAALAAEPTAEHVEGTPIEPPSEVAEELAAVTAAGSAEHAVPEAARAADAAIPVIETNEEAAPSADDDNNSAAAGAIDKLAAGVAAAVALLHRKSSALGDFEQQVKTLTGDKNALSAELAAKTDAAAQLEAQLTGHESRLVDLQDQLIALHSEAESAGAAKASLEEKLNQRGSAWSDLLARIAAVNTDLDALLATEPAEPAEGAATEMPAAENSAGARSVEMQAEDAAAPAPDTATSDTATFDTAASGVAEAQPVIDKLAAAVAAAAALFGRKQAQLADLRRQLDAIAGDKGALESTLTAKDQALVAAQAKVEQLQNGINQRALRFDALSMHASGLEADIEIAKLQRTRLEDQVRAVAASLQSLCQPAPAEATTEASAEAAEQPAATAGEAVVPSPLDELAAAAAVITELVRSRENDLHAAQDQLGGLQAQLQDHGAARQSLAAELESRGANLADFETRLQSLQGEYSGLQTERGDLQATLQSLNDQLNAYLTEYGEADEDYPLESAQPEGENAGEKEEGIAASPAAVAPIAGIGLLLKRRKDALESANARIGELEAEISALTSAKSELDTQAEQQEQALADLTAQLEAAQAEVAARAAEIETLQQQVNELTAHKDESDAQAQQKEQALADLTAQLEAAQAEAAAHTTDLEALQQQVNDLTAHKSDLEAQAGQKDQSVADLTAQLETAQAALAAAQADAAARTTEIDTLRNQMSALQAEAAAAEQERVRLDAQWRGLNDDLAQFGAALDADDDAAIGSLADGLAQKMGGPAAGDAGAVRSVDVPLVKTAGALALTGVAAKKLAALKATRADLATLQQEQAALLAAKSDLEGRLQSTTGDLEATKTQLAAIEEQLAEAKAKLAQAQADHSAELQVLDDKTAELQSKYNEAESTRLRLEASLTGLNQELQQLSAVLQSDDDEGLQQFVQKLAPAEVPAEGAEAAEGEAATSGTDGSAGPLSVAAVAAAVQRKQAALKEADARAAAIQAQLDEVSADREAAKALLADRDQALQEVETKLTEVTVQVEKQVSDFKAAARTAAAARGVEVQTTNALQDFADLKHIGVTFEQRLYRAGVGTFWEVAHLTDEDFALILRLTEMQQLAMNMEETRADAVRFAEETNTVGVISAGDPPDDFEPIQGIGKVFEQRLYSAGIRTYWDLANASEEQLAAICKARRPLVPDYASWIRQARIYLEVRSGEKA